MIEVRSGNLIDLFNPDPNKLLLSDISAALARICRFGGHTEYFYSVLHHSLNCYYESRDRGYDYETQRMALAHDFTEAFIGDSVKPLKIHLETYNKIEEIFREIIYEKYSICGDYDKLKDVDYDMSIFEARWMMKSKGEDSRWDEPSRQNPSLFVEDRIRLPQSESNIIKEFNQICDELRIFDK